MLILQYKTGQPPVGTASAHWDPNNYTSHNSYRVQFPFSATTYGTLAEAFAAGQTDNPAYADHNLLVYAKTLSSGGLYELLYIPTSVVPTAGQWIIDGETETSPMAQCSTWQTTFGDTPDSGNYHFNYDSGQTLRGVFGLFWPAAATACYTGFQPSVFTQFVGNMTCYTPCTATFPQVWKIEPFVITVVS